MKQRNLSISIDYNQTNGVMIGRGMLNAEAAQFRCSIAHRTKIRAAYG